MKIIIILIGFVLFSMFILNGCAQQQYIPTTTDDSQQRAQIAPQKQECKVEDRGTGYFCFDVKENWAWKGKVCDTARDYVITESVACINNKCQKAETIIKNCKDYGSDWICGYRTSQAAQDTVCAKPDWSQIKDV